MATDVPGRLFVLLQLLLPRYALTRLVHWIARIRWRPLKDALIRAFARLYSVDLDEAAGRTPLDYPSRREAQCPSSVGRTVGSASDHCL
jgi:phosphatidylserine decarboxylase